jgi:hypothetical protein
VNPMTIRSVAKTMRAQYRSRGLCWVSSTSSLGDLPA